MRLLPLARLSAGVALFMAVLIVGFVVWRGDAEAPDQVDYFGATEPDVCFTTGIGPHLCLTDAPPTSTPDTRDQRAALLGDVPELVPLIQAAESGDVDGLLELAVKANLCAQRFREPIEVCTGLDYLEAVQQASGLQRPSLRLTATMGEWLTNLFAGGGSRLDYVARNEPTEETRYVLVFRLPEAHCISDVDSCDYDKLVLYVLTEEEEPIDQFSFYSPKAGPPYDFWMESGGITNTYEVLLGDCALTRDRTCRD